MKLWVGGGVPEALSPPLGIKLTSLETGAEAKNTWIYTPTPPYVFVAYFLIS
jgi:hypothetical protein